MSGRIHVFPNWQENPYLNMLYVGVTAEGWLVEGSKNLEALTVALRRLGRGDILHVHWTSPILHRGDDQTSASAALEEFTDLLRGFKARGGVVMWTVHNAFTHDALYPDLEIELGALLAEAADRIIQINPMTREAVSEHYALPEAKTVTLRHASYAGIYGDPPERGDARRRLGLDGTATVVGFVGQMRPYKGLPILFEAVDRISRTVDDLVLVLAGKTAVSDLSAIERQLPVDVRVVRHHSFIPDAEIGRWFAACDVVVFPYEKVLNSGSILLASTFGCPCVIPGVPHLIEAYRDQSWVTFYDPGDDRVASLADAILMALQRAEESRGGALDYAAEYRTFDMAWDYVAIVESTTAGVSAGGRSLP